MFQRLHTFLLSLFFVNLSALAGPIVVPLWPAGPAVAGADAADTARVEVFLPVSAPEAGARAVVICPGGGYDHLAFDNEGRAWAAFFNARGIAAIVLKYRMPHGTAAVPVSDATEALRLTRRRAAEWHINPADVGIMGSSAGGHLATTIATHAAAADRPAFQILFYPVVSMDRAITHAGSRKHFLGADAGKEREQEFSNALHVGAATPRAFITLADDDTAVPPVNGVDYYIALTRFGIPAQIAVWPRGGHGFGMKATFPYHAEMLQALSEWLETF